MRRILVDVNVLLDAVLARPPHAAGAARIWAAVETARVSGLVPAHGVTTLFYIFARSKGVAPARRAVGQLLSVFKIATVNESVLRRALTLDWPDFEDAVCSAAAEAAGCDLIVTRDPAGFANSPVPAADPATALSLLDREGGPGRLSERSRPGYAARRGPRPARAVLPGRSARPTRRRRPRRRQKWT